MKYIFIKFLIFCCLTKIVFSKTTQTPESTTFLGISISLDNYRKDHHGELPKDWDSLVNTPYITPQSLALARKYLDIENRYHFTLFPKPFEINGVEEKFVVMANQSGKEGDFEGGVPGRRVIIETSRGEIQPRRYREDHLKMILKKNGYDLADYTFDTSNRGKRIPKTSPVANPLPPTKNSEVPASNALDLPTQPKAEKLRRQSEFSYLWMVGMAIFLVFALRYIFHQSRFKSP